MKDAAPAINRCRVWWYLAACTALSALAVAAGGTYQLALLTATNLAFAVSLRARPGFMLKALKLFLVQSVTITVLYQLRFGSGGITEGLTVSWRLALAFLPGLVFMYSVPPHIITAALGRVLPHRTAFVLGATMTFLPRLVDDTREIYHVQALRGAKVTPRDMLRPSGWRDAVGCILIPAIVRAMTLAHEIALAAEARGFGARNERTNWPGE